MVSGTINYLHVPCHRSGIEEDDLRRGFDIVDLGGDPVADSSSGSRVTIKAGDRQEH